MIWVQLSGSAGFANREIVGAGRSPAARAREFG